MCAARRDWTDEIFALFVNSRLGPVSAREVCEAVDWISTQPELLAELDALHGSARERRLESLVDEATRRGSWRPERPKAVGADF